MKLGHNLVSQQDKYPKRKSKLILELIKQANIYRLEWLSHCRALNRIRNLWTTLQRRSCAKKLTNVNEVYKFCQEEWSHIQPELFQRLIGVCQKHLVHMELEISIIGQF